MNPYGPKIRGKIDLKNPPDSNNLNTFTKTTKESVDVSVARQNEAHSLVNGGELTSFNALIGGLVILGLIVFCRRCMGATAKGTSTSVDRSVRNLMDKL